MGFSRTGDGHDPRQGATVDTSRSSRLLLTAGRSVGPDTLEHIEPEHERVEQHQEKLDALICADGLGAGLQDNRQEPHGQGGTGEKRRKKGTKGLRERQQ